MATIIEEGNNGKRGAVRFVLWLLMLGIIGAAGYYIFFAEPQLVTIPAPAGFKIIDPLAGIDLRPDDVLGGALFKSLKHAVPPPPSGVFGKSNPFAP